MAARELMTANPTVCTMDTPLQEVARMMVQCNCGEIPVVERPDLRKPVGVVTDRDIVCRIVAEGRNPLTVNAGEAMTSSPVCVREQDSADEVMRVMEAHQIRRVPVVNQNGEICGIISQADIAKNASRKETGDLVKEVSKA